MADLRAADVASSSATEDFEAFYERWIVEQQRFLDQLIRLSNQDDVCKQEEVVQEVMSHYVWYYEEKAKAHDELCLLQYLHLVPPWLSSLEKVVLWMGGFKPSFALSLLEESVADMLPEQRQRVEVVRAEVEEEEREVEEDVERVHEVVMAGRGGGRGGVDDRDIAVVEELKRAMREVIRRADRMRRETVEKAVAALSGRQTVKFLVVVGSYHLGLRSLGLNHPSL